MDYTGDNSDLVTCQICERNFNPEALRRHEPICRKTQQKKRKVFDSSKQRADGTEIMTVKKRGGPPPRQVNQKIVNGGGGGGMSKGKADPALKKNNWRQKHEEFVRTIRAARGVQTAMARGDPLPPPPPPTINPDYVQCEFCGRRFNESAAQRHVVFCKEQHERLPKKKPEQMTAAQKMAVRTQYQPPKLKKGGGSDYYAGSGPMQRAPSSDQRGGRGTSGVGGSSGYGSRNNMEYSGADSPVSGHALRTGRTMETYTDARKLSAKQTASLPSRKYPSSDSIHSYSQQQYTGTGYVGSGYRGGGGGGGGMSKPPSRPMSGEDWNRQYGASYGYGSPGTVPRGRGAAPRPANGTRGVVSGGGGGGGGGGSSSAGGANRFCYDCGCKFPTATARFCCECGAPKA